MKINEFQPVQRPNPYAQHSGTKKENINISQQQKKTDEVSISEEALQMAHSPGPTSTVSEMSQQERSNRVDQIKQSIQDGTYQVNPREVARKIYDTFSKQS